MSELGLSDLDPGMLVETWNVDLADYIIDLEWSPDASSLAAVTVEGFVHVIGDNGQCK